MKIARVLIQIIEVYAIDVEVPNSANVWDAEVAAYDMQTIDIRKYGKLYDVETAHAQFQEWEQPAKLAEPQ